ncbi:class I SAM-dependent methyltransferase [Ureibacillus manganicus]|uniref:rRNA methyltransferase n=1 Tax=Ureibacillus manganicus DSM 26584 TaxID=1384049 RepID=A0A0A3HQS8_9BACL|nr:class I SAM-dependent methyltransferase [Ureibacillus manganicus]KGR74744.1 rRNA methyltransferase [Ureibacillus manganicus DSM 26584]
MKLQRVLQYAKFLLAESIEEGEIAVDATAGNGHDTLYLAEIVGENGHVYSFDIQQEAIDATTNRLIDHQLDKRATVILDGHQHVAKYVTETIAGAVFNLGYLPGANHEIITTGETTIQAIESLLSLLKLNGIIVLVIYHGHEGGKTERDAVLNYVSNLPQKYFQVLKYEFLNQKNDPPFIVAIEKTRKTHFDPK